MSGLGFEVKVSAETQNLLALYLAKNATQAELKSGELPR
jgi:hypothetical protein